MRKIQLIIVAGLVLFCAEAGAQSPPVSAQEVISVRPSVRENAKKSTKTWNRDFIKGYHGFIDFGGGFAAGSSGSALVSASTSHGYQFNPYYYLGVGVGYNYHAFTLGNSIPLFGNFRANLFFS